MKRLGALLLLLIPAVALLGYRPTIAQTASTCGLASPAFCDTFDAPAGTGNRSGQLNGIVWGVSRLTSNANPFSGPADGWFTSQQQRCGAVVPVLPDNDIAICGGQLVESVNDGNQNVTTLAMYPKQPFDFAGRTGKVVFDVNADSQSSHAAWPAFAITDLPIPAPSGGDPGLNPLARNSFGFTLASTNCAQDSPTGAGVDRVWITRNYVETDLTNTAPYACVLSNPHETAPGPLNHFEVDISSSGASIYGTDAGTTGPLTLLAQVSVAMPLTRGLVWIEDVHYNACKYDSQCDHTFAWDNVGFDGPILARDLSFDVIDHTSNDLGWLTSKTPVTLQTQSVRGLPAAQAVVMTLNWWPTSKDTITYSLNGHAPHTQTWPFPDGLTYSWRTIALPVPIAEVQAGVNTITIATSDQSAIANIDLKLVGAGGVPQPPPTGTPVPTATGTATPTATATVQPPTPTPALNVSCTGTIAGSTGLLSGSCTGSIGDVSCAFVYPNATGTITGSCQ